MQSTEDFLRSKLSKGFISHFGTKFRNILFEVSCNPDIGLNNYSFEWDGNLLLDGKSYDDCFENYVELQKFVKNVREFFRDYSKDLFMLIFVCNEEIMCHKISFSNNGLYITYR